MQWRVFLPSKMLNIRSTGNYENTKIIKELFQKFCKVPLIEAVASKFDFSHHKL
jgi:hypothetical protein